MELYTNKILAPDSLTFDGVVGHRQEALLMGDLYMLDEDLKSPSGLLIKHLHQFGEEL